MSEANILNVDATSLLNPDYPDYADALPPLVTAFVAKSGETYTRVNAAIGRVFDLQWMRRPRSVADQLLQWEAQYRNGFFSYQDLERGRYFTGRFDGPPLTKRAGYNQMNISARFVELCNKPMFAYPANWARDAVFMEERDDSGVDQFKLTGTWIYDTDAHEHGGHAYESHTTNDTAELLYFGYGFRWWSIKWAAAGIAAISVDGGAETNVDAYNAATLDAAPLFTNANLPLGFHRVKIRCTGTKNGASTDFWVFADAIEVMQ